MALARCNYIYSREGTNLFPEEKEGVFTSGFFPSFFSLSQSGNNITLPTPNYVMANEKNLPNGVFFPYGGTNTILYVKDSAENTISGNEYVYDLSSGVYTVRYRYYYYSSDAQLNYYSEILVLTYEIAVVKNRLPLKKYTVTDVVNRCLELIEPLQKGQNPRFTFDGVTYIDGVAQ